MKHSCGAIILILLFAGNIFAQEQVIYTGKAENVKVETSKLTKGSSVETPMGIAFEVVVKNEKGEEIARIPQYVSAGVMIAEDVVKAVKNIVDRQIQEIYAHTQGATEVIKSKIAIEAYISSCDKFIESDLRPNPQSPRVE